MARAEAGPSNWALNSVSNHLTAGKRRSTPTGNKPSAGVPLRFSAADLFIALALFACTVAVYFQTRRFDFVNYDDPEYVTANPHVRAGLTLDGLEWAFTSTEAANWFPLTRLSEMLDGQLFGLSSGGPHLVNVFWHAAAALLLFAFLTRATGARWPAAFVAFVFALHPVHVESVAWIAERKDVLSGFFWFLTLWAYVRYAERRSAAWYALVVAAFCCGLMAKPMIVTLPLVLLLLDVWPLRRRPALKEKLPLFALAAAASVFTFLVQQQSGAVRALAAVPLAMRVENALVSYAVYIWKTVWPSGLSVFYPYPARIPFWQPLAAAAALAAISYLVIRCFRTMPHLAVGWLWFLITLAPVIGLVQVGSQSRADRYLYVPMIGLLIMLAFLPRARGLPVFAVLVCGALVPATYAQIAHWRDSETLFRHALAVTADNPVAEHNLGSALLDQPEKLEEAAAHLREAVRLAPDSVRARTDLGTALAKMGKYDEAIGEYNHALRLDPQSETTRRNLENAVRDMAVAHYRRGMDLARSGASADAIGEVEAALRIRPDYPEAHNDLGVLWSQVPGRSMDAISQFQQAIRLKPDYVDARYNLAVALADRGRTAEAIVQLEDALRIHDDPQIREAIEKLRRRR